METRNPQPAANRTRLKVAAVATPLLVLVAGAALWFPQGAKQLPSASALQDSSASSSVASQEYSQTGGSASETIRWVHTISHLPVSLPELAAAHEQAKASSCEAIPVGERAFSDELLPFPTDRDSRRTDNPPVALCQRRPVFSVGLDMNKQDRQELPALSGGQILSYLRENYISLQVRLLKSPASETFFLHHRPLACVTKFPDSSKTNSAKTEKPTAGMSESLNNYRSLGVFLPAGDLPTAENLRTLVLLHKGERVQPQGGTKDTFEYVFLRLAMKLDDGKLDGEKPSYEIAAFATSDDRTRLHQMHANSSPTGVHDCSLKSLIRITKYSFGIYPSESETLNTEFNDVSDYSVADLQAYAASEGWQGDLWDNLNQLLDAILDAKLPRQLPQQQQGDQ